jgi:hypothetical protein
MQNDTKPCNTIILHDVRRHEPTNSQLFSLFQHDLEAESSKGLLASLFYPARPFGSAYRGE